MRVSGTRVSATAMVCSRSATEIISRATGSVTSARVKAVTFTIRRTSYSSANGSKTSPRLASTRRSMTRTRIKVQRSRTSRMPISYQVCPSCVWPTQHVSSRKPWRRRSRIGLTSVCSTFLSRRCSQHRSLWILKLPLRLSAWVRHL